MAYWFARNLMEPEDLFVLSKGPDSHTAQLRKGLQECAEPNGLLTDTRIVARTPHPGEP
jgi:hypothetical protein